MGVAVQLRELSPDCAELSLYAGMLAGSRYARSSEVY